MAPTHLMGLTPSNMQTFLATFGAKPFHAKQTLKWLYERGVRDVDAMTDLSLSVRDQLREHTTTELPLIAHHHVSNDGTQKWLLDMGNRQQIETVFIPESKRGTLCVSSQAGCALNCSFCATGAAGFNRHLKTHEIVSQLWLVREALNVQGNGERVTNVVFMGMGEPLANVREVIPAVNLMTDDLGFGLSRRRVTVSTSGVVPNLEILREQSNTALAISLHAPNDELRSKLVPINQQHPIKELLSAAWRYAEQHKLKITFEYVMLNGVNDQIDHAKQLAKLLKGKPAKVNLIPFNPFPGNQYTCSPAEQIAQFQTHLHNAGIRTTTRKTRGDDVDAACGQLAGDIQNRVKVPLGSRNS